MKNGNMLRICFPLFSGMKGKNFVGETNDFCKTFYFIFGMLKYVIENIFVDKMKSVL